MIEKIVVFESPRLSDKKRIESCLKKGFGIFVIEPFNAYHHRGLRRFFPPVLPGYVLRLLEQGKISLLTAEELQSRYLNIQAAELAVDSVEKVYPEYWKHADQFVHLLMGEIGDGSESVCKKYLCDRLGDFFSMNILLSRLSVRFRGKQVLVYPHTDILVYDLYFDLVKKAGFPLFQSEGIRFPKAMYKQCVLWNIVSRIKLLTKLSLQAMASFFYDIFFTQKKVDQLKRYAYACTVVAPNRQFRGNQRGVDFLVDNKIIKADEFVYIPTVELHQSHLEQLKKLGDVFLLPRLGRFFTNWKTWARLTLLTAWKTPLTDNSYVEAVATALFSYYRWQYVLCHISISNFISHSDFATHSIARNLLFRKHGVTTWYYTDATNFGHNFRTNDVNWNRHPFWTYLSYDHFVTWSEDLAKYFRLHPGADSQTHVVGSLWAGHVQKNINKAQFLSDHFEHDLIQGKYVIAVFTSTYTVNSITSYDEAVEFLRHIKMIADDFADVLILIKEKKDPELHMELDPQHAVLILDLYEKMMENPRIYVASKNVDTSKVMAVADLSVSFPFTSTTNEALASSRLAVWHDPMGCYDKTPYAKYGGVVTHGYDDLKKTVSELKQKDVDQHGGSIKKDQSTLFDPYRDGKAIERFRLMLANVNND